MPEACHVADQFCEHAANYEGHNCRAHCFACGEPTCVACSIKLVWFEYGRKRICHNCVEQEYGRERVMEHLSALAGYGVTPGAVRR